MLNGLHFALLLEEDTNPTEFTYSRLRLIEAGARVSVIGLDRLEYRLEDHSIGYADTTIDFTSQNDKYGCRIRRI